MKLRFLSIVCLLLFISSCSKVKDDLLPANSEKNVSRTNTGTDDESDLANARKAGKIFKGSITYHLSTQFDLPCNCNEFASAGSFYGTGHLTHLGFASSKIKPCVSPIFSGGTFIGNHVGVECASFVADCGDELDLHIHPYDILLTSTGPVGYVNVDFDGGTGKFKHATGSFTGTVTILGPSDATLTNINGIIRY